MRFLVLRAGNPAIIFTSLFWGPALWAQTIPPLSSTWLPGALPGGGGIFVPAFPVVSGEPFTANNDSRRIEMRDGKRLISESHSILARDSLGRVANRTSESPHVPSPGGGSVFIPAGGSVIDPVAMVQLRWSQAGPPGMNDVVYKTRIVPEMPPFRPAVLDACEREGPARTRRYRTGVTQQIEEIGERTIQGIFTRGCRVTTVVPAGITPNSQPGTSVDERWSSPLFRIALLHTMHSSDGTEEVQQLDNIVLGTPDASLFEPPPDFKTRDMDAERAQQERAEFTVAPGQPEAETLAGYWEATDPFAGGSSQVGILLKITANRQVPFDNGKVTGTGPEKFMTLQIGTYARVGGETKIGWSSAIPREASWDGNRLQTDDSIQAPVRLDLVFDGARQSWTGSYMRNGEEKPIVLTRQGASLQPSSNPFVGVWSQRGRVPGTGSCIFIAKGSDGTLLSWMDTKTGPIIDRREGTTRATFQETDGDALGVQSNGDTLILRQGLYWSGIAGRPPWTFTGKLSPDGTQVIGSLGDPGASAAATKAETTTMTRVAGGSCW